MLMPLITTFNPSQYTILLYKNKIILKIILVGLIFGNLLKIWIWQDFNLVKSHCHNNYKLALCVLQLKWIKADN